MIKSTAKGSTIIPPESMSEQDYKKFSEFVYERVGIKLTPAKQQMEEARLQKRMRALGLHAHRDYVRYLFSPAGQEQELTDLIDAVTTNTTDFFRERQHVEYLERTLLPRWLQDNGLYRRMSFWSAGCSIGMEPSTMAMVLLEFAATHPGFEFGILGTDISTKALRQALRAIYDEERVAPVPQRLKEKYLLRSRDRKRREVRMGPELRRVVTFRRLNFMEDFSFEKPFDVIFCRNVVIYFDRPTQERLFARICRFLKPGGHLFIGHSESLAGMDLPLQPVMPTVYKRD